MNFDEFLIKSSLFDRFESEFESKSSRQIAQVNSDRKSQLEVNSNTISIEFPADLDLIALAYLTAAVYGLNTRIIKIQKIQFKHLPNLKLYNISDWIFLHDQLVPGRHCNPIFWNKTQRNCKNESGWELSQLVKNKLLKQNHVTLFLTNKTKQYNNLHYSNDNYFLGILCRSNFIKTKMKNDSKQ